MLFDTFPSVANADDVIKGISNSNERFMTIIFKCNLKIKFCPRDLKSHKNVLFVQNGSRFVNDFQN